MPEKSPSVTTSGQTVPKRPYERFIDHLGLLAEASAGADGDGDDIAAEIMDRMLTAGSLESAMEIQNAGLPAGKDFVDVEQSITTFEVRKGDPEYEEHSLGFYLKVDAVRLDSGENITYAVGARNIVTLLVLAMQEGKLPMECVFRSRKTANGALLTLQFLPKRVVRS